MSAPASPSAPPRLFDPRRRAARLARAAHRFADADFLHRRAAHHMAQDLEFILRDFAAAVDVSAHPGLFEAVAREQGVARLGAVSIIEDPAVRAQPASAPLPVADGSADLIVSVLSLHWSDDLPGALAQIRRALKPDGLFLGALFGGTTLNELRGVLTEAELEITGGAQARISPFADGFDGAALLQRAGFALPAVDVDRITVRYSGLPALIRDLRAMGETSALAGPARPVRRDVLARAAELYADRHADPDGRICATFEIIHLTGWAPHDSQPKPARRGSATVRLADALNTREITGEEDG